MTRDFVRAAGGGCPWLPQMVELRAEVNLQCQELGVALAEAAAWPRAVCPNKKHRGAGHRITGMSLCNLVAAA